MDLPAPEIRDGTTRAHARAIVDASKCDLSFAQVTGEGAGDNSLATRDPCMRIRDAPVSFDKPTEIIYSHSASRTCVRIKSLQITLPSPSPRFYVTAEA